MTTTQNPQPPGLQAFLDSAPLGARRIIMVILGLVIITFDGLDLTVGSFVWPQLETDWGTQIAAITTVVTLGTAGMAVGAAVGGPLADRVGRKAVIIVSIATVGLFTLVGSTAPNIEFLGVVRFIASLGLGAAMPATITNLSELVPSRTRTFIVGFAFAGFTVGTLVAGVVAGVIVPTLGWRGLLVFGGVLPLVLLPFFIWLIPESPMFLALRHRAPERVRRTLQRIAPHEDVSEVATTAEYVSVDHKSGARVVLSRAFIAATILLAILYFLGISVSYLAINYLPLIMSGSGLSVQDAALVVTMFGWGGAVGCLVIGAVMGKLGRFRTLAIGSAIGALSVWAVAAFTFGLGGLAALGFLWGFFIPGVNAGINSLAVLTYPPEARATGLSWMHTIGRVGSIVSAILGGLFIGLGWGISQIFFVIGFPLVLSSIVLIVLGRVVAHIRRSSQINAEALAADATAIP